MAEQTAVLPAPMAERLRRAEAQAQAVYLDYGSRFLTWVYLAFGSVVAAVAGACVASAMPPGRWLLAGLVQLGVSAAGGAGLGLSHDTARRWFRDSLERGEQ